MIRVNILEKDPVQLKALAVLIRWDLGYEVECFIKPQNFLKSLIGDCRSSVFILGFSLSSELTGLDVARLLIEKHGVKPSQIIFLTAYREAILTHRTKSTEKIAILDKSNWTLSDLETFFQSAIQALE